MDQDQKQTVATLGAAIVIARQAKSVAGIRGAWADANWINMAHKVCTEGMSNV
jgi:hypothetical protein